MKLHRVDFFTQGSKASIKYEIAVWYDYLKQCEKHLLILNIKSHDY
jgi:hypothetical protein